MPTSRYYAKDFKTPAGEARAAWEKAAPGADYRAAKTIAVGVGIAQGDHQRREPGDA